MRRTAVIAFFGCCLMSAGAWTREGILAPTGSTLTSAPPTPATHESVLIDAGYFWMGNRGDETLFPSEGEFPQHKVWLDAYRIDKYEVTNFQYNLFIEAGGYDLPQYWSAEGWEWRQTENLSAPRGWGDDSIHSGPDWPDHPVVGVSWYEAKAYCRWTGRRLPTEAEWEKAARWQKEWNENFRLPNIWPWGDFMDCSRMNTTHCGTEGTVAVDSMPEGQSPYGVFHVAGNVWEYCEDSYDARYYEKYPVEDWPRNPVNIQPENFLVVLRGGGWSTCPDYDVRVAMRSASTRKQSTKATGFRTARTISIPSFQLY